MMEPMKRQRRSAAASVLANIPGDVIFYLAVGIAIGFWNKPVFYLVALAIVVLPFAMKEQARRRHLRNTPTGLCSSCGYDLRATPHRCPECGAVPTKFRNSD